MGFLSSGQVHHREAFPRSIWLHLNHIQLGSYQLQNQVIFRAYQILHISVRRAQQYTSCSPHWFHIDVWLHSSWSGNQNQHGLHSFHSIGHWGLLQSHMLSSRCRGRGKLHGSSLRGSSFCSCQQQSVSSASCHQEQACYSQLIHRSRWGKIVGCFGQQFRQSARKTGRRVTNTRVNCEQPSRLA